MTLAQVGRRAGLHVVSSFTSEDGGNVMCVFEKTEVSDETAPTSLPGNARRVTEILRSHTALSHAFTPHPYLRPLRKLRRRWEEAAALRRATDGKTLLQAIAREVERPQCATAETSTSLAM